MHEVHPKLSDGFEPTSQVAIIEVFDKIILYVSAPQILKYNTYSQGLLHYHFPSFHK
jgi:hypothetical protein